MPTSKTVRRVPGAGMRSGPMHYQRLASTRMVPEGGSKPTFANSGEASRASIGKTTLGQGSGSMEGWRKSRQKPKGGPEQSEYRRVKR